MGHSNIAIFVPHLGCPCKCSFCNQFSITEHITVPHAADVDSSVMCALQSKKYDPSNGEIAFFGGSFTAINRDLMLELLSAAKRHIDLGHAKGIRISTRPDCIDDGILSILRDYGVTSIELGAQSMRDSVLTANSRGHTAADVESASQIIKNYGFELGLQMMTGLYGDDDDGAVYTARKFIDIAPETVRIYPTIVLADTALAEKFRNGEYTPQSIDDAAALCSHLLPMFENAGIKVIRLGLHSIDLERYVAGPWHPAFSEICESLIYRKIITEKLTEKGSYKVFTAPRELSKTLGQCKSNKKYFENDGFYIDFYTDSGLTPRNIRVERE